MSTQGLISIVKDEKVLYKIVVGCNGMKIADLVKCIKTLYQINKEKINAYYLYRTTLNYNFGCKDCLVVFNESELETDNKNLFHGSFPLFLKTFNDPNFNPRWEYGTADYTEIINLNELMQL
jgi:hypothetical protein